MSTIKVLNMAGAEVGTVELCDSIFGIAPNQAVVHELSLIHISEPTRLGMISYAVFCLKKKKKKKNDNF